MQLIDRRTEDGSRHFVSFPHSRTWEELCEHILQMPGAEVTNFVVAGVSEAWMDFRFRAHEFSIRECSGEFYFLVRDPRCPDLSLLEVASHCNELLGI